MAWRYIAQRATTGAFLDLELPLHRDELSWELSGAGALRATASPDVGNLRAADGRLVLEEWGTLIYAEADGQIRWGGIVISSKFNGADWTIEAAGFSTYPNGQPYTGVYTKTGVDPAVAVAHIWDHLQSFPDGDLGLRVTGDRTAALVGLPTGPVSLAQVSRQVWDYLRARGWNTRPGDSSRIYPPDYDGDVPPRADDDPLEPYSLLWWEAPDCGSEISSLASETPFDYVERHYWNGDTIAHELEIGYPRLGRRRTDLAFIQGDNVADVVTPEFDGDAYANAVIGLGAGEGQGALRRSTAVRDGRLRRATVYSAKDVATASRLDSAIGAELRRRLDTLTISSVSVRDHPNARIGSWELGDDVLIQATIPWLGDVALWCRITGWTLTSESTATLSLARSDSFTYGGN